MAKILPTLDEYKPAPELTDERGATPERLNRGDVFRDSQSRQHMRDSPINRALSQHVINAAQFNAASKFYLHWFRAGLSESYGSADLNRVFGGDGGGAGMARTEAQAFHRQRFRAARDEIEQGLGGLSYWVAEQIVCHEKPFTEVGQVFGHKNRTKAADVSKQILLPVLNLLCKSWGIIA